MSSPADQEILITVPAAHCKKQQIIYQSLRTPGLRETWVGCGTKFGKTLGGSVAETSAAFERPGSKWRWVAPIYSQAQLAMEDYFPKILPPPPHSDPNKSEMKVRLPHLDTVFEFWHAQNPGSLEGAAVHGYVFDEASRMKPEIRASARTTTTRTQGPMLFISYPFGKNWFYTGCMEAKEHMQWALKHGKVPEKIFIHARTTDNPFIDKKVIEDARKELPDRLFRQFYLAEFVDDGQVFIGFRDRVYGPDLAHLEGERQRWFHEDAKAATVVVGVDWAKTTDWTVFIAADIETRRVVAVERFHRHPYTEAIRRLQIFCRQFKSTLVVRHDKTGVGTAIDDVLAHASLPAEGVIFTNQSKGDMVAKLMTSLEVPGQLYIPRWPVLISELDAYDVTTTATGYFVYGAPSGKHDDTVSAMMLANTALIEYGNRAYEIKFLEDLPKAELAGSPLLEFYAELADDV